MRAKPEVNGMENIFGQLVREAKWTSEAKRIASNVRNTFRQEVSKLLQPVSDDFLHYSAHYLLDTR
jgi:hypothetical protein